MEKLRTEKRIEKLKIPDEVVDTGWENSTIDFETYKREKSYVSPKKVSNESIEKIKNMKLNKDRGHTILSILFPSETKNKTAA